MTRIYSSPYPSVTVAKCSIFTYIFSKSSTISDDVPAFIDADTGRTVRRAELKSLSLRFAWGLKNSLPKLGGQQLHTGDTIMIFSPNSLAWSILMCGSLAAGIRLTLANSAYTAQELAHQWKDSQAKVIFVHPMLVSVAEEMFRLLGFDPKAAWKRIVTATWELPEHTSTNNLRMEQLLNDGILDVEIAFDGSKSNETALLCYSSGTTGKPKGVETMHRNLTAICDMVEYGLPSSLKVGKDSFLGFLPFYHVYGAVLLLLFPIYHGFPVVIMPRFDPVAFCKTIETYQVTVALVVPPVLIALARHPAVPKYNLSSMTILMSGAAPLGSSLARSVSERLRACNCRVAVVQGYGLTELSPSSNILHVRDEHRKMGSVGPLLPNLEARIVVDGSQDALEGEPGELWIRGPTVMKGYLNRPDETAQCITSDGFLKTGDIASCDSDGYFTILDRMKELIKYKGFQVAPADLEGVLLEHPLIADAAVVGIYSEEEATELPRAYVVHAKGLQEQSTKRKFGAEVQKWIETRVAKQKYLRGGVVVIDAIPKSASGKILRRELRELAKADKNHYRIMSRL